MRKIPTLKKQYFSLLILFGLLFFSNLLFAQNKTKAEKQSLSYFKASASYLTNNVYNGRKDSLLTPYTTPSLGYYDKSGFYISGSLSYLSNSSGSRIDLFSFDAGYDFSINDDFIGSVYANKSFYNKSSTAIQSDISGSAGSIFTYDAGLLQVTAGVDILFAQKADISTNIGIAHAFYIGDEGSQFSITPTVTTNMSTLHFYEGYTAQQVIYPIRVMKQLGVKTLLLSNAAGGVNPTYAVGDLMIINDHISFFTENPLMGKNEDEIGTRFPDMSEPYCKELIAKAHAIAKANGIKIYEGVYTAVTGPTFETRAEYKLIKILGSDVVGMSTVQETIAAAHCGIKVFGVSVVTDMGIREDENIITHEEVLQAAKEAEPKLALLFNEMVRAI